MCRYKERAEATAGAFQERLADIPLALPQMCCSLFMAAAGHLRQVIIAGKAGQADTTALLQAAYSSFTPDKVGHSLVHLHCSWIAIVIIFPSWILSGHGSDGLQGQVEVNRQVMHDPEPDKHLAACGGDRHMLP